MHLQSTQIVVRKSTTYGQYHVVYRQLYTHSDTHEYPTADDWIRRAKSEAKWAEICQRKEAVLRFVGPPTRSEALELGIIPYEPNNPWGIVVRKIRPSVIKIPENMDAVVKRPLAAYI